MPDEDMLRAEQGNYRILLVEDNAADLVLIKRQLEKFWPDCTVMPVRSIEEAYSTYKNNDFDLMLLDLNLPDGYGPQTVQEVRRFNKRVPIVVVTGMGANITVYEALKLGANNVVLKSQILQDDFKEVLSQNLTTAH